MLSLRSLPSALVAATTVGSVCGGLLAVSPKSPPSVVPERSSVLSSGIWVGRDALAALPTAGPTWKALHARVETPCGTPNLAHQDDAVNVCVLAQALIFARTGDVRVRLHVMSALVPLLDGFPGERSALALGRELGAYVVAADLIDLKAYDPALDRRFRETIRGLRTAPTTGGPANLIQCHEQRPNNWGTHCGATRAAIAAYLGDTTELARVAQVFKGWLGDRSSYAGFKYGSLSWQCNPAAPVGINAKGCTRNGHSIDGVLPDDQRRAGGFAWPPPQENYVYEALQGALVQAVILRRAGYDAFDWQDQALLRAFQWLHSEADYPAEGDDTWQPHLVNHYYATNFPAPIPSRPGKNVGWTDWTHRPRPPIGR